MADAQHFAGSVTIPLSMTPISRRGTERKAMLLARSSVLRSRRNHLPKPINGAIDIGQVLVKANIGFIRSPSGTLLGYSPRQ